MSVRQTCQYQYGKHVYIKVRNQILCARKFNVPKSKKLGERLKTLDRWDLTALQTLQNGSELLPRAKRYLYSKTRHLFNTWQEIQEHIHKNMAKHEAMKCHEVPWSAMELQISYFGTFAKVLHPSPSRLQLFSGSSEATATDVGTAPKRRTALASNLSWGLRHWEFCWDSNANISQALLRVLKTRLAHDWNGQFIDDLL